MSAPHTAFKVYWILRDESVSLASSDHGTGSEAAAAAAAADTVGDTSHAPLTLSFQAVSHCLLAHPDDFVPYPPCTEKHLRPVDAYLVAVKVAQRSATDSSHEAGHLDVSIMGVVAVAWVDLSASPRMPANAVQGYLQVVLVPHAHRRRGIADALLSCLFAERNITLITSGLVAVAAHAGTERKASTAAASPNAGPQTTLCPSASDPLPSASADNTAESSSSPSPNTKKKVQLTLVATREERKEADGTTAVARPISSWMLHTMSASSVATRAYLRHLHAKARQKKSNESVDKREDVKTSPVAAVFDGKALLPLAEQVDRDLAGVKVVMALYTRRGFTERRTLYRYYGNLADAVEMVKPVERSFKTNRE